MAARIVDSSYESVHEVGAEMSRHSFCIFMCMDRGEEAILPPHRSHYYTHPQIHSSVAVDVL